jgi:hypothetical protein
MKTKSKRLGFYIELTEAEDEIIHILKKKYAVNISQLLKNHLVNYFKDLENR